MSAAGARGHVDLALVNVRHALARLGRESGWEVEQLREVRGTLQVVLRRLAEEQEGEASAVLPGDSHAQLA